MSLEKSMEHYLGSAREYAAQGEASSMETVLYLAQDSANKEGKQLPAEEIKTIAKTGYKNSVPIKISNARHYAEQGDATLMECCISLAQHYAEKAGIEVNTEDIKDIEKEGYTKAVPIELESACRWAREGNPSTMECALDLAQHYAAKVGIDVSEETTEIANLGYKNAVPKELASARRLAQEGDCMVFEYVLETAQHYATKAGVDVSKEVAEIRASVTEKE